MSIAGLVSRVERLERRAGPVRVGFSAEHPLPWFYHEAVARWAHGDREDGLRFARYYARLEPGDDRSTVAMLRELVVIMTPARPFAFDLLPSPVQDWYIEQRRLKDEQIINAPATPWDPYGACPLAHYLQDDEATARCGYRVALTRDRLDGVKAHWDKLVERSHEVCRQSGVEPIAWSGVVDWEWYYANAVPPHTPEEAADKGAWSEYNARLARLRGGSV
jgi:hypothetical protein